MTDPDIVAKSDEMVGGAFSDPSGANSPRFLLTKILETLRAGESDCLRARFSDFRDGTLIMTILC